MCTPLPLLAPLSLLESPPLLLRSHATADRCCTSARAICPATAQICRCQPLPVAAQICSCRSNKPRSAIVKRISPAAVDRISPTAINRISPTAINHRDISRCAYCLQIRYPWLVHPLMIPNSHLALIIFTLVRVPLLSVSHLL